MIFLVLRNFDHEILTIWSKFRLCQNNIMRRRSGGRQSRRILKPDGWTLCGCTFLGRPHYFPGDFAGFSEILTGQNFETVKISMFSQNSFDFSKSARAIFSGMRIFSTRDDPAQLFFAVIMGKPLSRGSVTRESHGRSSESRSKF